MTLYSPKTATKISSSIAFFLLIFKTIIGIMSGSVAVIASALDSLLDFIVSLVNFFTLKAAQKPADEDHSFGHGKFEAFAELMQSLLIGFSGLFLIYLSIKKIMTPEIIKYEVLSLGVMIIALIITILLYLYLKKTAEKSKSLIIKADTAHYYTDILTNTGVIISLILTYFFKIIWIDALTSIIISFFILHAAIELFKESFNVLTDAEISIKERAKIEKILNNNTEIIGWHDLKTRYSGSTIFIEIHLEFRDKIRLIDAHEISEDISARIQAKIDNINIITHFDTEHERKHNQRGIS